MHSSLVFVVDSLGEQAFGRTRAALTRAGWFARQGYAVYVATWNMKPGYPQVFDRACASLGISGVTFLNLYQFFSEGDLYAAGNLNGSPNRGRQPGSHERFELDRNGALMRRSVYASDGDSLLKAEAYAPTSNGEEPRLYLALRYSDKQKIDMALWVRKDGAQKTFSSEHELYAYWFAAIAHRVKGEPVFISEVHDHDDALLSNAYVDHPLTVIASISSTLYRKPYRYGAKLNRSVSILKRISDYDAVVVPTAAERSDMQRIVGHCAHLYAVPYSYEPGESELPDRNRDKHAPIRLVCCLERKSGYLLEDIPSIFATVRQKHEDAELDVYGPKAVLKTCKKLFKGTDAQQNVHLIEERFVPADRMCRYDAYISVDSYAALDLSMIEARYAHVPIIAYDYDFGPREVVDDATVGTLVKSGDVQGMADAIEKRLPRRGFFARFRQRKGASCERFSPDVVYGQWQSVIEEACQRSDIPKPVLVDAVLSREESDRLVLVAQLESDDPVAYELSRSDDLDSYCNCHWIAGAAQAIAPNKQKVTFSLTDSLRDDQLITSCDTFVLHVQSHGATERYRLHLASM